MRHAPLEFHIPHCRPAIAEANGVKWSLFKDDKEAVAATDEMIAQNRLAHPELNGDKDFHSKVNPTLCSKFVYIVEAGYTLSWNASSFNAWDPP